MKPNEGKCSKCGSLSELAPSNLSRKTGERLHRSWCVSCEKARKAKWVQDNLEHVLTKTKTYQDAHPDTVRETKRRWAANNKEYHLQYKRQHREQNPERYRAYVSARRKKVQQHTPPWSIRKDLVAFYEHCPEGHHVDHVIPLRGKLVSGLHVIDNLQYLPAKENMSKRNHYVVQ